MAPYNQKTYLFNMIDKAFSGVELGSGVSLHETIVIDNYGSKTERQRARENDEKKDWRKLISTPELKSVWGNGGLNFYDDVGLRFHLPAYLYLLINEPEEGEVTDSVIYTLTTSLGVDSYNYKRLLILNNQQRKCVRHCLIYLRHNAGRPYQGHHTLIEKAIEKYWKPQVKMIP